jgi:uncharacterized protein (DUF302 family)
MYLFGLRLRESALSFMLATIFSATAPATEKTMTEVKRLQSAYPFAETVQLLRSNLESQGLTIFAIIDQREAARSVGLDMPPTTLLIYGNPKGGTPLMIVTPDFGIELPLKLLVREEADGQVLVVYIPAHALEGRHGLPTGLAAKLEGTEPLIAAAVGAKASVP